MGIPKSVTLREDGPREGFQMLSSTVTTGQKLELIDALGETGISEIEVTSFVRPDLVPQLADCDDLCSRLKRKPGIRYRALYLNAKGFDRAAAYSSINLDGYLLIAASETFLKENNNRTITQALSDFPALVERFKARGLGVDRLVVSSAFGDTFEGKLPAAKTLSVTEQALVALRALGTAPSEVTFADTTGWGDPESVRRLVGEFRTKHPDIIIALHLHDTRGTGMANVYAGLLEGVTQFDCSVGGMGGCPFASGAAGNVPTEDVAYLCESLGAATGLDLDRYVECAKLAERITGIELPGKLKRGGVPKVK